MAAAEALPSGLICPKGVAEGGGAEAPVGDGFIAYPATSASAFEVDSAAQRGAAVTVRVDGAAALGASVLEKVGVK